MVKSGKRPKIPGDFPESRSCLGLLPAAPQGAGTKAPPSLSEKRKPGSTENALNILLSRAKFKEVKK